MTPQNFVYWLQGYFEIIEKSADSPRILTASQVQVIKDHLKLAFTKVTSGRKFCAQPKQVWEGLTGQKPCSQGGPDSNYDPASSLNIGRTC